MTLALPLLLLLQTAPAPIAKPAPATVTFYAPGGFMRGSGSIVRLNAGKSNAPSTGFVFDGSDMIAKLIPGRFLTFELTPGPHHLAASGGHKPGTRPGESLDMQATSGRHYFVRMTATKKGFDIVLSTTNHLDLVSCEDARSEADGTKPDGVRLINKSARARLVDGTYFPRCDAPSPKPAE